MLSVTLPYFNSLHKNMQGISYIFHVFGHVFDVDLGSHGRGKRVPWPLGWGQRRESRCPHTPSNALATLVVPTRPPSPPVFLLPRPPQSPAPSSAQGGQGSCCACQVKARICHGEASGPGGLSQLLPALLLGTVPTKSGEGTGGFWGWCQGEPALER